MALVRCKEGHYYDKNKYDHCPQCGIQFFENDPVTIKKDMPKKVVEERDNDPVTRRLEDIHFVAGWLVCIAGEARGRDYRIYSGKNYIGRESSSDISIYEDNAVSRKKHCAIVYDEKHNLFYLVPEKGLTYLDNNLLEKSELLSAEQQIIVGESSFIFIPFCTGDRKW